MENLIKQCKKHILNSKTFKIHNNIIKKIVNTLNKDKIIILSWIRHVGKINIIKELLSRINLINNIFYFNKDLDIENVINNSKDLEKLFIVYMNLYNIPKIIILENTSKIKWIKNFIPKFYNQNKKIIIIWNNLKIKWVKEIEILPENNLEKRKIDRELKYWILNDINYFNDINYLNNLKYKNTIYMQEKILTLLKNDIFLKDIFINFWIKNIILYNYMLTYLSKLDCFTSLREIQKKLHSYGKISIKTTIDYIDYSIQAKILKRIYICSIKTNKIISSRGKYYFTDLGIRNSLNNFELSKFQLLENFVFNELYSKWYNIYAWKNGNFEFSFVVEKNNTSSLFSLIKIKENKFKKNISRFYIHISREDKKKSIKKEIKKLNKIKDDCKKFLIVGNLEELKFKKYRYEDVRVIGVEGFLKW